METRVFPAKIEHMEAMLSFINEGAKACDFDEKKIFSLRLACEEALVNVINYAYPGKDGELVVTYRIKEGNDLEIEIKDAGIPFDPLAKSMPDINAPLLERKIGGLGIYLIRKTMDAVSYRREDDKNIFTLLTKKITGAFPSEESDKSKKTQEEFTYHWPISYMKKEEYAKGQPLFKKGDHAEKMYYINKGSIRLVEINKVISSGQVIGEMGIFSPFKERTASAVCEEDVEAYTMGKEEVMILFSQDPRLAINLIQLSIKRFIENLKAETEKRERIASELRIAQEIQISMLPSVFPKRPEFELYAMMDPAKEVGGDFYDFFFVDKKRLCFVIGDVSGKGVPAALFMAITKTLVKNEAMRGISTGEILSRVNNILCPDNQTCLFVTIFCAILDIETGQVQYCNAGHNPPLVCDRQGCTVEYLKVSGGLVVGVMENTKCEDKDLTLKPGDLILLYTDGVTEAMNLKQEQFSEKRLLDRLTLVKDKDIKSMIGDLREVVHRFAQDEPQSDDITMLALRYRGNTT